MLTAATLTGSSTEIQGLFQSTPNTAFTLEFFANDVCNASGYGEGQTWLGDATVVTNANGRAAFTVTVAAASPGQFIAATATDAMNDTSQFSACLEIPSSTVRGSPVPTIAGLGEPSEGLASDTVHPLVLSPVNPAGATVRSVRNAEVVGAIPAAPPGSLPRPRSVLESAGSGNQGDAANEALSTAATPLWAPSSKSTP